MQRQLCTLSVTHQYVLRPGFIPLWNWAAMKTKTRGSASRQVCYYTNKYRDLDVWRPSHKISAVYVPWMLFVVLMVRYCTDEECTTDVLLAPCDFGLQQQGDPSNGNEDDHSSDDNDQDDHQLTVISRCSFIPFHSF